MPTTKDNRSCCGWQDRANKTILNLNYFVGLLYFYTLEFNFNIKMRIRNTTKNRNIAGDAVLCDDIFSKFIGLMFSKKRETALVFRFDRETIIALHMLFVFYPIDVLFLDKKKNVVDKKENFLPFTFYKSRKKAMYAVELPNGAIGKTKTEIGDKIEF